VIGVVTSWEGYPIKHYVFTGNTKDETTVGKVIEELKENYNIEETTFVGDRGMITKLNLNRLEEEEFNYIMGVKIRQNEMVDFFFDDDALDCRYRDYDNLRIQDRKLTVRDFLIWKTEKILREAGSEYPENRIQKLREILDNLNNDSGRIRYAEFKTVLGKLAPEQKKIRKKIFRLIKKYHGKYDNSMRAVICLNPDRKKKAAERRNIRISELLSKLGKQLDIHRKKVSRGQKTKSLEARLKDLFSGYRKRYRKFFEIKTEKAGANSLPLDCSINSAEVREAEKRDGIFILTSNLEEDFISDEKVIRAYKDLREIEDLFDDLKNFVQINPVRHFLEKRVRSHVFICILALLLKRLFEIEYYKSKALTEVLEEIDKSKMVRYRMKNHDPEKEDYSTFCSVTVPTEQQKKILRAVGIKRPMAMEKFCW
jgi:transposase